VSVCLCEREREREREREGGRGGVRDEATLIPHSQVCECEAVPIVNLFAWGEGDSG
jgi:hypothetical protein